MNKKTRSLQDFLRDLEEVINIESHTADFEGVEKVAHFFAGQCKQIGLNDVKILPINGSGPVLLASNDLNAKRFDVMLVGHLDTVFQKGFLATSPFRKESDNIYKGPGIIDDKGSALLGIYALEDIDFSSAKVLFLFDSCEETGSPTTKELIAEYAKKSRSCLILEAARPNGELVYARKGIERYNIKFSGVAAHSGNSPEKGVSAVVEAANWIKEFSLLNDYEKGHTFNSIVIEGGKALNIIPDSATISIEMRYVLPESLKFLMDKMENLKNSPYVKGTSVIWEHTESVAPMFNPETSPKIKAIVDLAAQELGMNPLTWVSAGGGSVGNTTAPFSPTIDGLGPIGGNMHSKDEYLEIDSVTIRRKLLAKVIEKVIEYKEFK